MKHYKNSDIGVTIEGYKRIDRREARRLWAQGKAIVVTPSRVDRLSMWGNKATKILNRNFGNFDEVIEEYEGDYCYDMVVTGDYAKFYVQVAPTKKGARK